MIASWIISLSTHLIARRLRLHRSALNMRFRCLDLRAFQLEQKKPAAAEPAAGEVQSKQAAELLGLTYHQLRAQLKKHQL